MLQLVLQRVSSFLDDLRTLEALLRPQQQLMDRFDVPHKLPLVERLEEAQLASHKVSSATHRDGEVLNNFLLLNHRWHPEDFGE